MSKLLEKPSMDYFLCWFAVFVVEMITSKSLMVGICNCTTTFASD